MNKFAEWKKIIGFGVIGAVGCLIGAAFGELLFLWAKPAQEVNSGAAGLVFNADLTARLQRENAQSGDVQISLMWNNRNDLDLHVVDPNGEEINYQHRRSGSGGELDVDANRDPRSAGDQPVENVYWPAGGAPLGTYKVLVNHYQNNNQPDPTDYIVGIMVGGATSVAGVGSGASEFPGQITFRQPKQLVHEFTVEFRSAPQFGISWYAALITGLWTGLLAVGLSVALAVGQNYYLHRPLLSAQQGALVFGGGLAAGVVAGGAGQVLFGLFSQFESLEQFGRIVGWLLLGAILGRGMGYFIANLSGIKAALAGAIGGLIAALAFAGVSPSVSELAGRLVGAAILGVAIGLMVAVVEAVFRGAWLEVKYGPNETRKVSLGTEPVSVGGDANACTIYARNAAAVAFRYRLDQGRVTCEDVGRGQTVAVQPESSRVVGNLTVTVRAAGATPRAASAQASTRPAGGFSLRLSTGKTVLLSEGVKLSTTDIPGLQGTAGAAVAEVGRNPNDPSILGLKNLSRTAWTATLANRDRVQVDPGRNVRIAAGTKISFGSVSAEIQK